MQADNLEEELSSAFPGTAKASEGGYIYYLLPKVRLPGGCQPETTECLFCPTLKDGYPSRLYFPTRIKGRGTPNWNGEVRILNRTWYAYSWSIKTSGLTALQTVAHHLQALR